MFHLKGCFWKGYRERERERERESKEQNSLTISNNKLAIIEYKKVQIRGRRQTTVADLEKDGIQIMMIQFSPYI